MSTKAPEKAESPASEEPSRLAALCWRVALALVPMLWLQRTLVSGIGAELVAPWSNAFLDGLAALAALILLAALGLERARGRRLELAMPVGLGAPALAMLAVLVSGYLAAENRDLALRSLASQGGLLIVFLAWASAPFGPVAARRFALVGLAIASIIGLLGVYEYAIEQPRALAELEAGTLTMPSIEAERQPEFLQRIRSRAAVGPFLIANLLGGFLAMWWPVAAALTLALWRRRRGAALAAGLALGLIVLAMLLTRSKGFMPASLAALMVLVLLRREGALSRARRRLLIGLGGFGAAAAIVALLIFARDPEGYGLGLSLQVRLEYWSAGLKIARENPIFGVGLNNYGSAYSAAKTERSEETKYAHNTVVQVLADQGALGLLALLWFIIAAARCLAASPDPSTPTRGRDPPSLRLLLIGLVLGLLFLVVTEGRYNPEDGGSVAVLVIVGLVAAGLVALWVRGGDEQGAEGEAPAVDAALAQGLQAGLVAFLVHGLFDFSYHAHGLLFNALAMLALALHLRGAPRGGGRGRWLWAAVLLLSLPLATLWPGRLFGYGAGVLRGRALSQRGRERFEAGEKDKAAEAFAQAAEAFAAARERYHRGFEAALGRAVALESLWKVGGEARQFAAARQAYDEAAAIDPRLAAVPFLKAGLLEQGFERGLAVTPVELLQTYDRAARLYPTQPRYRYRAGRLRMRFYEATRANPRAEEAQLQTLKRDGLAELSAALRAHENARLTRVKLDPESLKQARALIKKYKEGNGGPPAEGSKLEGS